MKANPHSGKRCNACPTYPMVCKEGQWRQATWKEALRRADDLFQQVLQHSGNHALAASAVRDRPMK